MSAPTGFRIRHLPEVVGKRRLRRRLLAAQHGRCVLCAGLLVEPTMDHLIPVSRNGSDARINLALACYACNNARGDAPLTDEQVARVRQWFGNNKYAHVLNDPLRRAAIAALAAVDREMGR